MEGNTLRNMIKGAVTFDETEKAREGKKKVPFSKQSENETVIRLNFFEILQIHTGFFYRRLWGSTYSCTPHAPNSTLLA